MTARGSVGTSVEYSRLTTAISRTVPNRAGAFTRSLVIEMIALSILQTGLGLVSGAVVGFSLGLVGGGGSILAVPLMIYLVGVTDSHVAIGTSAVAVAANAAASLVNHAHAGNVKWRCAAVFAIAGIAGAYGGSSLGK